VQGRSSYPLVGHPLLKEFREIEVIEHSHWEEHIDGHLAGKKIIAGCTIYESDRSELTRISSIPFPKLLPMVRLQTIIILILQAHPL